jgi:hypothetical protein
MVRPRFQVSLRQLLLSMACFSLAAAIFSAYVSSDSRARSVNAARQPSRIWFVLIWRKLAVGLDVIGAFIGAGFGVLLRRFWLYLSIGIVVPFVLCVYRVWDFYHPS